MRVSFKLVGQARAIEMMTNISVDADRAQQSALRAAARRARSLAAKDMASQIGVPQKIFAKRIAWYVRRPKRAGERRAVLWGGLKREPRSTEHPRLAGAIQARNPGAFWLETRGRRKLVVRRGAKLVDAVLDLDLTLPGVIEKAARAGMDQRYTEVLIHDFNRRVQRRTRRSR